MLLKAAMVRDIREIFPGLPDYVLKELDPHKNMIRRVMMVGAETQDGPYFGLVDSYLLKNTLGHLQDFKMPLAPGLGNVEDVSGCIRSDLEAVPLCNVREEFGGRNFLENEDEMDVVVFCNIPVHSVSYGQSHSHHTHGGMEHYLRMERSFSRAGDGDDTISDWQAALRRTDPKFVFLYGGPDCHGIEDLKTPEHVSVSSSSGCRVLIRKDILQDLTMHRHFLVERSPLASICTALSQKRGVTHFMMSKEARLNRGTGQPEISIKVYEDPLGGPEADRH